MRNVDNSAVSWKDKYALQLMNRHDNIRNINSVKIPKLLLKDLLLI